MTKNRYEFTEHPTGCQLRRRYRKGNFLNKKILLVDDEADVLEMLTSRLKKSGFEILIASTGPEALEAARLEKPGLIILDVMMPQMNGYDVLERLKAAGETSQIPVIMASAKGQKDAVDRALAGGAAAYLVKPFSSAALMETVHKALENFSR